MTVGIVGINSAATLTGINLRFHDHPFTVVKNIGQVRIAFRTIPMGSRDLVLAENPREIDQAEEDIDKAEKDFLKFMEIATVAYLGDKKDFESSISGRPGLCVGRRRLGSAARLRRLDRRLCRVLVSRRFAGSESRAR